MLTFAIFPNTKKQNVQKLLPSIIEFLEQKEIRVLIPASAAQALGQERLACDIAKLREEAILGITLGGDGTLLNTARDVAPAGLPVCGVNLGQLGFLTEVELPSLYESLEKLIRGEYSIEERLMLDAVVLRNGEEYHVSSALNDAVVSKGGFSRMIRMKLYIDGNLTMNYPADGLIVSTATGSTGYSLSAGGPIVNPNLPVLVVTPICPHTLHARSLVVSDTEEIRIAMNATHNDIILTVDGQTVCVLEPDDEVLVRRSPFRVRFIHFAGRSYYETLRTKLRRGDRFDYRECDQDCT